TATRPTAGCKSPFSSRAKAPASPPRSSARTVWRMRSSSCGRTSSMRMRLWRKTARVWPAPFRGAKGDNGPRRQLADFRQVERLAVAFEHSAAEQLAIRPPQGRIGTDKLNRVFAGHLQDIAVGDRVRVTEFAQAVLAGAEKLAAASQAGVLLGQG